MNKVKFNMMRYCCFIVIFSLNCSFIYADSHKSNSDFKDTIATTSSFITKTMNNNEIIGLSIALIYDNEVVWVDGFGLADKENDVKAESNTTYMLGSGSKTLTTVALLQYLDKGLVSLEDPVSKHIKEFKMLDRFSNQQNEINVHRLLNHHSGIPGDLYNNMGIKKSWNYWGINLYADWLLAYLQEDYPSYAPGEVAIYCNTGFIFAGELIKVFNKDKKLTFNEIMTNNLLKPLSMKSSSFEILRKNLAKGYISGKEVPPIQFNGIGGATGGLFTNIEDMSKFIIMLLNDGKIPNGKRVLNAQTVATMGEPEVSPLDINSYFVPGLGFDSVSDPALSYAGRVWIKDGSTGNFNSIMGLLPDKKLGIIILTNCDTSHLQKYAIMRECLKNALIEKFNIEPVKPKYPDWISISNQEKLVGKYVYSSGYDEIVKPKLVDLSNNLKKIETDISSQNKEQKYLRYKGDNENTLLWKKHLLKAKTVTKKLLYNGKRYSIEDSTAEIVFKDIDGHLLMIQYGAVEHSKADKYMYDNYVIKTIGEKIYLPVIPDEWKKRIGRVYLIDNMGWNDLGWDGDLTFTIIEKNGSLMVVSSESQLLIVPHSKDIAFVQGLNNRGDSSIRFTKDNNTEQVSYSSFTGRDIKNIPAITKGHIENPNLPFPKTAWYKFSTDKKNEEITFKIDESKREYKLRLFDKDLKLVKNGDSDIKWKSEIGDWYLAVSPLPGKKEPFILEIFIDQ